MLITPVKADSKWARKRVNPGSSSQIKSRERCGFCEGEGRFVVRKMIADGRRQVWLGETRKREPQSGFLKRI